MSQQFIFDYQTFYNYYTDSNNPDLYLDQTPETLTYYFKSHPTPNSPKYFITIGGTKIYITDQNKSTKDLLFSIPTIINGEFYDNHYHFGIDLIDEQTVYYPKQKKVLSIYFHKTLQRPQDKTVLPIRCSFRNGSLIIDVENIICNQEKMAKIKDNFDSIWDIEIIKELISRPFIGVKNRGGCKKIYGYNEIINPLTSRKIKINGSTAKIIIKKFLNKELKLSQNDITKLKSIGLI